jgi:IS605 OrfB family transposase
MNLTYVDRFYPNETQQTQLDGLFRSCFRFFATVFNEKFFGRAKPDLDYKKITHCSQFNIGTKYANSLIKLASDRVKLHKAEIKDKTKQTEKRLKRIAKERENTTDKSKLWELNREEERLNAYLRKNKSVTFGSKKLQAKDINLWKQKRNNFAYGIGEHDVIYGNNTIKLKENELQIQVCNRNVIKIPLNKRHQNKNTRFNQVLGNDDKKTILLIKRNNKYYIHVSFEAPKAIRFNKKMGLDFNYGFISYFVLKNHRSGNIRYEIGKVANKNKESMTEVVKRIINFALANRVGVINIENLNFTKKKQDDKSYMLHKLPYARYIKTMKKECYKVGIRLRLVNPAYTSQNAMKMGLDRHIGAAMLIAQK